MTSPTSIRRARSPARATFTRRIYRLRPMTMQRDPRHCNQHEMLDELAHQAMIDRGLEPDFSRRGPETGRRDPASRPPRTTPASATCATCSGARSTTTTRATSTSSRSPRTSATATSEVARRRRRRRRAREKGHADRRSRAPRTRPRSTPRRASSRCCRRSCRPISRRSTRTKSAWRSSSR